MNALQQSWSRTWQALAANGTGQGLKAQILACYSEPHRHYHTLQHLNECLAQLEQYRKLAEYPEEVEIALWFHDAVYDTHRQDNEARSAAWAALELAKAGVSTERIERVNELIMASCYHALPEGSDQKLLVDIDLAILGAEKPRFMEYESQVRKEYFWVPEELFCEKRGEILRAFLLRAQIYNTELFRDRFEHRAHENLNGSVKQLGR